MIPFMKQINITYRCGVMYRDKQLASLGLNGCQTPYLTVLYRSPGISQEDLARQLNVNKSSVARQLAALESLGYVRREVSPEDRRALLAYPTDKALAIREQVMHVLHAWRESAARVHPGRADRSFRAAHPGGGAGGSLCERW